VNSVPDNYTLRAGGNYTFDRLVFTAGIRYEGAPAYDLFGKNDGLRKVGHIFSVEPGIEYKFKTSFLYTFVTIPLSRATIQTVPDRRATEMTGTYTITGGDLAGVIFFFGYAFTF
jgi:long-subunit fatty acid transport protein